MPCGHECTQPAVQRAANLTSHQINSYQSPAHTRLLTEAESSIQILPSHRNSDDESTVTGRDVFVVQLRFPQRQRAAVVGQPVCSVFIEHQRPAVINGMDSPTPLRIAASSIQSPKPEFSAEITPKSARISHRKTAWLNIQNRDRFRTHGFLPTAMIELPHG